MTSEQLQGFIRHALTTAGAAATAAAVFDPALVGIGAALAGTAGPVAIVAGFVWSFFSKV